MNLVISFENFSQRGFENFLTFFRKSSGTIDVIGGQTATISRVEGRRRHNLDGNNIQVTRCTTDALVLKAL